MHIPPASVRSTSRQWSGLALAGALALAVTSWLVPPAQAQLALGSTPSASWRVDGRVYATVIVGNTIVVGGSFTTATSATGTTAARQNLAAFSMSSGALLTGWRADAGGTVRALSTDGTSVWAGGSFGQIGGVTRRRIAKLSGATGAVDSAFAVSADATVRALELDGNSLYVGGAFLTLDGVAKNRIGKVNATSGALVTAFTASANERVYGLQKNPASAILYVAGNFSTLSGTNRNGVGAVSSTSGDSTGPAFGSAARPTLGLAINDTGTRLYAASGAGANQTPSWNTTSGTRLWRVRVDGDVQSVLYYDGVVYFGFHDGFEGDATVKLLAANADTGALTAFRPVFNRFWGVFSLAASPAGLVAGGEFTRVSGVRSEGFVRFPVS
ncbi:conserved exported hypothetical protein [metagenome]|uniref:Uncharacterized protein n=1 Tax=metagenome TaxID=256318 RepID=A0A2P2BZG8_9ZZZZ